MNTEQRFDKAMLDIIRQTIRDEISILLENRAEKEILSIDDVSDIYGWSRTKIYQMRKAGVITYYQTGRLVYFIKSEIDNALRVNTEYLKTK